MLYVTTRNNRDAFTAQRALTENRGPDGGLYLPFREPSFSPEELAELLEQPFNQCVAQVLNLLFRKGLTAWDVDFAAGKNPVRLKELGQRIFVAEAWHNPRWCYDSLVSSLTLRLRTENREPGNWVRIAVGTAVLFGIFGQLRQAGVGSADVCMVAGDFSLPISAWYARRWGLPIGNIVLCCNENNNLWDLICHGQLRTDAVSIPTGLPEADVALPVDLERLVYGCGGALEVERYLDACSRGRMYCPNDAVLSKLRKGLHVSVVSSQRLDSTIPSVYRTHGYLLSPGAALAYAGLLDYRARAGQIRYAVIFGEKSSALDAERISRALGISPEELKEKME